MKRNLIAAGAGLALAAPVFAQSDDASRALSRELRADATARTSLLAQDGSPAVTLGGYVQFRYDLNFRDQAPNAVEDDPGTPEDETVPDEDTTAGFQTARTKINARGTVAEDWGFFIQGSFLRGGGDFRLDDAFITHALNDAWVLKFGQFRLPYLREETVLETRQLAVDRSVTNETFKQDRSQGIQGAYTGDSVRFTAAFSDGLRTASTDFDSPSEADYALTGRLEWKWGGDWKALDDFTSWRGSDSAGMLGAAIHWQDGGETGGPTADTEILGLTADVSVEGNGWNAFAACVYRQTDAASSESLDDWGWLVQGGVFLAEQWELFGRFDMVLPDDNGGGSADEEFSTITVGVNHYVIPQSHALKLTGDVQYYLDSPGESIVPTSTGTNLLPDNGDGQWAVRLQLQLVF